MDQKRLEESVVKKSKKNLVGGVNHINGRISTLKKIKKIREYRTVRSEQHHLLSLTKTN